MLRLPFCLSPLELYEESESSSVGSTPQGSWHTGSVPPQDFCHRDFGKPIFQTCKWCHCWFLICHRFVTYLHIVVIVVFCVLQNILGSIGESLSSLVHQPLLKRKQVPGFLEEVVRYPKESLASLAHLVFVHHLAADTFPTVFRYFENIFFSWDAQCGIIHTWLEMNLYLGVSVVLH